YEGRFPFAALNYDAPRFPVSATLEAASPFVPLDAKNSALPLAFLTFTLSNRSARSQQVSLFGALKNCVGYDHPDNESVILHKEGPGLAYLVFGRKDLPEECQSDGGVAFGVWSRKRGRATHVLHAIHPRDIYDPVMETAHLENLDRSDFSGEVGNYMGGPAIRKDAPFGLSRGVLCRTMTLRPKETVRVTFAVSWFFPNLAQPKCRGEDAPMEMVGHRYQQWFSSAEEVMKYGAENFTELDARTREFVDAFYATTRPRWLLDAINAQMTTLVKSSWWDREGRFAIWEGLGCCGMQTPDITFYGSFPIVLFFPELQKSQMQLSTLRAEETGRPPHGFRGSFSPCCLWGNNRIDNSPQFILLVWRDAVWTGDVDYVRRMWPYVEIYLKDMAAADTDGDGLANNAGVDQTYDQFPLYGTSAYVGLECVGALRGAAAMARMMGLDERAAELDGKAASALATLEEQLWNGQYYDLSFDKATGKRNAGCMADQLCGDWFVRQTDGTGLVPDDRAKKALKAVFKHCRHEQGYLANCDWPKGGRVKIRRETSDQANCPWTGVEYAVAAEMVLLGLKREGLKVTREVWDRYERYGMRYNHIECGGHYYRAMSSWAIYIALYGFAYDATDKRMTVAVAGAKDRFVWNTPTAWGTLTLRPRKRTLLELEGARGSVTLRKVTLKGVKTERVSVKVKGKKVPAGVESTDGGITVTLRRAVALKRGVKLEINR
ncbi:MAG: GH116 family glycosyl hydrolase, partial [Planctomycetota bacterium]